MPSLATIFALTVAMAFLQYNGFDHPPGQCEVSFNFEAIQNEGEQIVAYKARADVNGLLITQLSGDAGQADLTDQINALSNAYVDGGDLVLVLNNGSQSPNSILAGNTIGGTRVTRAPSFPEGKGAEYATYRRFAVTIEAEIVTQLGASALWAWEERLSFQGNGGPATDIIECVQGPPIPQTLKQQTASVMIQEGRAVGFLAYWTPLYNAPLYPALEQQQFRFQGLGSPRRMNGALVRWPSMWRYTHKSVSPITGEPAPWPEV